MLKVTVFRRCETLGLVAILSSLFERLEIVDLPDQICTYVGAVYFGMTSDAELRQRVAESLWQAMDQNPGRNFCDPLMHDCRVKVSVDLCCQHRNRMITLHLTYLRHFCNSCNAIQTKMTALPMDTKICLCPPWPMGF